MLTIAFAVITLVFCGLTVWAVCMYRAFDYNGKRQMARQIIEGTASCVKLPEGSKCLDVGYGSGALGIAVGKRTPRAEIVGIDRWSREYASFTVLQEGMSALSNSAPSIVTRYAQKVKPCLDRQEEETV